MTLVTLHRQAPAAPDASACHLCDTYIAGALQDHLLVGQPGIGQVQAVLCQRCGVALSRLVDVCGPDLSILIRDDARAPQPRAPATRR